MMQKEPLQVRPGWTRMFPPKRVHHERIWHEVYDMTLLRVECASCGAQPGRFCTITHSREYGHLVGFKPTMFHMPRRALAWMNATDVTEGPPWSENPPNIRRVQKYLGFKPRTIAIEAAEKAADRAKGRAA